MKVAIVEDEERAAYRLRQLLSETDPTIEVCAEMETVREVIAYDWEQSEAQLVFLDIQLADGSSFEIFKQISLDLPVIFTTAYDQYALEAFQVNSVDYLLKPIDGDKLEQALEKWKKWYHSAEAASPPNMDKLLEALAAKKTFTRNLLVQHRQKLVPVEVERFAVFYIENGVVRGLTFGEEAYFPEQTLDELELLLDPAMFYRANRQTILHHQAVTGIESYFNSRLLVSTRPSISEDILVSKAKAREFKNWVKGA